MVFCRCELAYFATMAASLRAWSMKSSAGGLRERFFTVTKGLRVFGIDSGRRLNIRSSAVSDTVCGTIVRNRPVASSDVRSGSSDVTTA